MSDESSTHRLEELTWEEAAETLPETDVVVLPCGSTEQHSLHLPLSVDSIRAENLTEELVRKAPEFDLSLCMLPTMRYGYSEHHMNFAGTISIDATTYTHVIEDIGASVAAHGAKRFAVLNCHGGNSEPLKLALDRIQRDHDVEGFYINWTSFARDRLGERWGNEWGHAGEHETSVVELYEPELVRANRKEPQTRRNRFQTRQYRYIEDITEQGGLGDPTRSDVAFMETVIEETTTDVLESIRADIELTSSP